MAPKRFLVPIGALALVASTLTAGPPSQALAAPQADVALTIALTPAGGKVVGKVKSPRASCKKVVWVDLYFKDIGATKFRYVAGDKSNRTGRYAIPGPGGADIPPGKYYVRTYSSPKCQAARSKTIRVS